MADATLNDIRKVLMDNRKTQVAGDVEVVASIDDLTRSIDDFIKDYRRSLLDQEEERREAKKQASVASRSSQSGSTSGGLNLFGGVGIMGLLGPLTQGLAAFGAAMVGLRGWELKAIANMKNLLEKSIPISIQNGLGKIKTSVFRIFGLTPEGVLSRDALGRFTRTPPITEQIRMRMNALRIRVLSIFGLGADGKLLTLRGEDGLFKKNIMGRVTFQIGRLLRPLTDASDAVAKWAGGVGKPIVEGLRRIRALSGGFLTAFTRILAPLGFLISAYDGVKGFLGSDEETLFGKMGDGVSSFFGSFFGAPLDLLKLGVKTLFKKVFGIETKDGEYDPENASLPQKILEFMDEFSFEETIKKLVKLPFSFIGGAVEWVGKFFDDPLGTLDDAWKNVKSGVASVADFVGDWVKGVWEWIKGFLPDVSAIAANFTNKMFNALPDWAKETIRDMEQARYAAPVFDSNVEAIKTRTAGLTQRTNGNTIIQLNQQTGGGGVAKQASVAASTVGGTEDLGAKLMMQGGGNMFMMHPLNPFLE